MPKRIDIEPRCGKENTPQLLRNTATNHRRLQNDSKEENARVGGFVSTVNDGVDVIVPTFAQNGKQLLDRSSRTETVGGQHRVFLQRNHTDFLVYIGRVLLPNLLLRTSFTIIDTGNNHIRHLVAFFVVTNDNGGVDGLQYLISKAGRTEIANAALFSNDDHF